MASVRNLSTLTLMTWAVAITAPDPSPLTRTYLLADRVIYFFLGSAWLETHVIKEKGPSDFFQNDWATRDRRDMHFYRVIQFAEMLFNLQYRHGFDKLLLQLSADPLGIEGSFAELEVAKLLQIHKMPFRFIVPQGLTKKDFDLEIAMPDGRIAYADTKCKIEAASMSLSSIKTSLNKARGQLPDDVPGMVFLKVPQSWVKLDGELTLNEGGVQLLRDSVIDFLRNTGRIVSVKIYAVLIHMNQTNANQMYYVMEIDNSSSRFEGNWEMFVNGFWGTGQKWIELVRVVDPLPAIFNQLRWSRP